MDCRTFRRLLMTDPANGDEAFLHHRANCPRCRDAVLASNRLEKLLRENLCSEHSRCLPDATGRKK
ncbi:MAG: hypothetical protein KDH88_03905 [Chromatiales bacterium]|nr:hypothetical protein [Chromatiales bacterium]